MIYNKESIIQLLSLHREKIKNYGAKRIGLFGSYVRNEQKQESDIDLLVEFEQTKKTYKNFIRLNYFLQDLFLCKIDLITLKSLPKNRNFTKNVLNQVIYATI